MERGGVHISACFLYEKRGIYENKGKELRFLEEISQKLSILLKQPNPHPQENKKMLKQTPKFLLPISTPLFLSIFS